jgi:hypothetical protein
VEEAYVVVEIKNKKSWVYEYVKIEPKLVDLKLHSKKSLQRTKDYFKNFKRKPTGLSKSFKAHDLFVKKDSLKDTKLQTTKEIKSYAGLMRLGSIGASMSKASLGTDYGKKEMDVEKYERITNDVI